MDGVVGFAPRILLWEEIERRVPKPELPEFRRMLGSSLIDKNTVKSSTHTCFLLNLLQGLQEEVLALVDIIKIVQADNDQLTVGRQLPVHDFKLNTSCSNECPRSLVSNLAQFMKW